MRRSFRLFAPLCWGTLLAAGCLGVPAPRPPEAWAPPSAPAPPAQATRPAEPSRAQAFKPVPPRRSEPVEDVVEAPRAASPEAPADEPVAQETPEPAGPMLATPPVADAAARLAWEIEVAPQHQAEGAAEYRIEVRNDGDEIAHDVVLRAEFAPPFVFPARPEDRAVLQRLGDIFPHESRAAVLSLRSSEVGRACCDFRLSADGAEVETRAACTEFVPRRSRVQLLGPDRRTIGDRAEFNLRAANLSDEPLTDLELTLDYDPELVPREASAGVQRDDGRLVWRIDRLAARETLFFQAEFECRRAGERLCLAARLAGAEVPEDAAEACLAVAPPHGALRLEIQDGADPVSAGATTTYTLEVTNRSVRGVRGVQLALRLPPGATVATARLRADPQRALAPQATADGVAFPPLPFLDADASATYDVELRHAAAGDVVVIAELRAAGVEEPYTASELTSVR